MNRDCHFVTFEWKRITIIHLFFSFCMCYVLTFDPAQKMLFQGDAPEGSDTFQWPVIERDRMGRLRLIIWDKVKVPLCQYRLMHQKRVTSELHDSYFRLMTIKHSISKIQWAIVWALNYYLTQLSSSPRSSWQLPGDFQTVGDKVWSLGSREDADKMQWRKPTFGRVSP